MVRKMKTSRFQRSTQVGCLLPSFELAGDGDVKKVSFPRFFIKKDQEVFQSLRVLHLL